MSELPPGFVLDQAPADGLPPGFVVDHPSRWMDAAKSVGSGLENATISTLGMAGDARDLLSRGVDALGRKVGVDLSPVKSAVSASPLGALGALPNSSDVRAAAPNPVVPPEYEPQTVLGGYLKTGAEFLPGVVDPELAGPSALRAAGKLLLTRVAAPAVASETAGQLTKGTDAEPYARVGGALLGGVGAARISDNLAKAKALREATPSSADIKSAASNAYDDLTSRNVAIPLEQDAQRAMVPFADRYPDNKIFHVDPSKVDPAWAANKNFYVGPGGVGESANPAKYNRADAFLKDAKQFDAPEINVGADGSVSFVDGRHRFAAMRDRGDSAIPVALNPESAANAGRAGFVTSAPVKPAVLDDLANDIRDTLNRKGIRPSVADSIHRAVDEIRVPANAGAPDVADLVAARQNIKGLLGTPDANKAGAFVALGKIEKAIELHSSGTMQKLVEADKNWAAMKAGEALDKRLARADLRAAGEHSGANIGNKIRQQVTNYLLSNEARFLPAQTKADLEKIVKGTATQNVIRAAANLLGGGGGLGMLAGGTAGYEAGGVPGAIAGVVAGKFMKHVNNRAVVNQAERAAQNIRRSSPLGQSMPYLPPPKTNLLLAGGRPAIFARPKDK